MAYLLLLLGVTFLAYMLVGEVSGRTHYSLGVGQMLSGLLGVLFLVAGFAVYIPRSILPIVPPAEATSLPEQVVPTAIPPSISTEAPLAPTPTVTEPIGKMPDQDNVSIISISPLPNIQLKVGQPTEFEIILHYTLHSVDQAVLTVFMEDYPDSAGGCTGAVHGTNELINIPVNRGEQDVSVRVQWIRKPYTAGTNDSIQSDTGFVEPQANLWTSSNGIPTTLIQSFEFTEYCYAFTF